MKNFVLNFPNRIYVILFCSTSAGYHSNCSPATPLSACLDRDNIETVRQRSLDLCAPILSKQRAVRAHSAATFSGDRVVDFSSLRCSLEQGPRLTHGKLAATDSSVEQ